MFTVVNGIRLYYERFDGRGTPTVLMHGWGADCSVMRGLFDELAAQNKSVVMFDFPYFGKSDPPPAHFGVYEYAETAVLFLKEQGFADVNLLGHSFGGRIALILAGRYGIGKKLILADAAGLKPKRTLKYRWKVFIYKLKKCFGRAPENAGSADYNALPDFMKPVFVRVVNTHLDRLLPRIKSPALLIWGENDRDTALYGEQNGEKNSGQRSGNIRKRRTFFIFRPAGKVLCGYEVVFES